MTFLSIGAKYVELLRKNKEDSLIHSLCAQFLKILLGLFTTDMVSNVQVSRKMIQKIAFDMSPSPCFTWFTNTMYRSTTLLKSSSIYTYIFVLERHFEILRLRTLYCFFPGIKSLIKFRSHVMLSSI